METINVATGPDIDWQNTPSALVVAHPGHEVRLHGWLELAHPRIYILTDGSGHSGSSRLKATSQYLAGIGVKAGHIYGQHTDRAVYQRVLDRDFDFFVELTDRLAESLSAMGVAFVAGDAAEGYNSIHDICRLVTDAAVEMLNCGGGGVASFDYPVVNPPDDCPEELLGKSVWLRLDDETFSRKLEAAETYYPELLQEVKATLDGGAGAMKEYFNHAGNGGVTSVESFRVECLRPLSTVQENWVGEVTKPFYELHGERQVEAGLYDHVIRYREHLAPIADRLRRHVG